MYYLGHCCICSTMLSYIEPNALNGHLLALSRCLMYAVYLLALVCPCVVILSPPPVPLGHVRPAAAHSGSSDGGRESFTLNPLD